MRETTLVNGVREDISKYQNICRMIIYLYDWKDIEQIGEDAIFYEDLFENNPEERSRFIKYLDSLEKNIPCFMNVQITESHVVLFYKTPKVAIFSRNKRPPSYMN